MTVFGVDKNREITRKASLSYVAWFCAGSSHLIKDMKGAIKLNHLTDKSFGKKIKANTFSQILTFPATKQ